MKETERHLPKEILMKAVMSGREFGWRREDVVSALEAASEVGLAILGGQVQFIIPDGICELYWKDYDPTEMKTGEGWESFSERSANETKAALLRRFKEDLVAEGAENFAVLKSRHSKGENLEKYLVFILYFQTKEEAEQTAGENASRPTA